MLTINYSALAIFTGLTVEQHATSEYGTTYRLYATFDDPGDWVQAVYGVTEAEWNNPMSLLAEGTASIYHTANAFGFNADYGNELIPMFLGILPDLIFDSWLTIGVEDNTGGAGPQGVGMDEALTTFNQGTGFADCGGAWFVASLSGPAPEWQAGDDLKVLLAQITMTDDAGGNTGHFSFQLNVQWRTETGATSDFLGEGMSSSDFIVSTSGCADPTACNYADAATEDDGSCEFTSCEGCADAAACNYDAANTIADNTQCEYTSCAGCLDEGACNYDESWLIADNIQCEFTSCEGCADAVACNYDAANTIADNTQCEYTTCAGCLDPVACNYHASWSITDNTQCEYTSCAGCLDSTACNFNSAASIDDGSCLVPDEAMCEFCNGADIEVSDTDGDGVCDQIELAGCTDPIACNFAIAATNDDGSCEFLSCTYTLTVEVHATNVIPGTTTYRFYIDMINETDFLSSIFGNDEAPLELTTPSGFYNDGFASGSTADGVNPAFFGFFPSLQYDSWVTIGIAGSPVPPQTAISSVESSAQPWLGSFNATSPIAGQDILINDVTGGAWYVLNSAPNGFPNPTTMRTLIMQVTCAGEPSGTINAQVFPLGVGANQVQMTFSFNGPGTYTQGSGGINLQGCTESTACNFDEAATLDDGSCTFADDGYDCAGVCLDDSDLDGVCDEFEIAGCQDDAACNYNMHATDDDGSCIYAETGYDCSVVCINDGDGDGVCDEFEIAGCTDSTACNYETEATDDDDSCTYPETGFDCDGNCINDADMDGVCDEYEIPGCTDSAACNYSASATDDNVSCTYPETGYDCDGVCLNDLDGDGICDEFEIVGCTADNACNYDSAATDDNGSCDFCSCLDQASILPPDYTMTVEEHAVGGIAGMTTYRFYIDMVNNTDFLSSIYGNDTSPFYLNTSTGFYNDGFASGSTADGVNPAFFGFFPTLAYDSWATIGIEGSPVPPQTAISSVESSAQPWIGCFNATSPLNGTNVVMEDDTGGAWYVLNGTPNGLPNATTMRTLFMQVTTAGTIDGTINAQVFPQGIGANQLQLSFYFNGPGTYSSDSPDPDYPWDNNACGCSDEAANNYDASAEYNDGSCEYAIFGCADDTACNYDSGADTDDGTCTYAETGYDCDGVCLNDADLDWVCDEFEIAGCQDATACNYNMDATDDDGSCAYAEAGYDCEGICINDADSDGVCDEFEIAGCTDSVACNYASTATEDNGSCVYAGEFYDCDGNCIIDSDSDFVCDPLEIPGCTDPLACNYSSLATDNDGSCVYPEPFLDCNWNCLNDSDGDFICDELEIPGCTASNACNYDDQATDDDGSCYFCNCEVVDSEPSYTMTVEEHAVDGIPGMITYRFYIDMLNETDFLSSIFGNDELPMSLNTTNGFYNDGFASGATADGVYPAFIGVVPSLAYDSWVTIGIEGSPLPPQTAITSMESSAQPWLGSFNATSPLSGQNIMVNDVTGGAWYVLNGTPNGLPDPNTMRTLFMQITASSPPYGLMNAQVFPFGVGADQIQLSFEFDGIGVYWPLTDEPSDENACGCTDSAASNYDSSADYDDGTCEFLIYGCTDEQACNFDVEANTDNDSCDYAEFGYDCIGVCLEDSDGDGICDPFEIVGCMDPLACNFEPTATDEGGCDHCSCIEDVFNENYTLTVEPFALGGIPGQTTYRFYIDMLNPTDYLSSIFGDNSNPFTLSTPNGFYNDPAASGATAAGVNSSFFSFFPSLQYDSWVTIGIESSPVLPQTSISTLESQLQPWTGAFDYNAPNAGDDVTINDVTGGVWYVVNGSPNGLPDAANQRTLFMQLTCYGEPSGSINAQVFQGGLGSNTALLSFDFDGPGTYLDNSVEVNACGCIDESAFNYNAGADYDDGSCIYVVEGCMDDTACNYNPNATSPAECFYPEFARDCDGNCLNDADSDGVCDELETPGCMDDAACNFNPEATDEDDSCLEFDACGVCGGSSVPGCFDPSACNFDPNAGCSDLSLCEWTSCAGCTDETACNFDPLAEVADLGTCTYSETVFTNCAGECLAGYDVDGNGVCDPLDYPGCTDDGAINYNAVATTDDGSCFYVLVGCMIEGAANYNPDATVQGVPVLSYCTFAAGSPAPTAGMTDCTILGACNYGAPEPCDFESCLGCTLTSACNYEEGAIYNDGSCEFTSCVGCLNDLACNYDADATIAGTCDYSSCVGCTDAEADNYDPTATVDNGSCYTTGCMIAGACNYNPDANNPANETCELPVEGYDCNGDCIDANENGICDFEDDCVAGCMTPNACNFNPLATVDSGNCLYFDTCGECGGDGIPNGACDCDGNFPEPGYSCEGECLIDDDGDGVCDLDEVVGCQDDAACNYDVTATEAGYCDYPADLYDCDGNCLNDADGDGICDALEVAGCTDGGACNYSADATDDDGSCTFAETGYDCNGDCLFDADGDGVCDQWEVSGCQDEAACNYDSDATDAGYCDYAEAGYDCDGDCLNDADSDGICDEFEVAGCTSGNACNFNAAATDEDGSCLFAAIEYDCNGDCLTDEDGDGICDAFEIHGCQDAQACNFDPDATDSGYCSYALDGYSCDGQCLSDVDGDGVCDEFEVLGCTIGNACNFDPSATDNDGSCAFAELGYDCQGNCLLDDDGDGVCNGFEVVGCSDPTACNFNPASTDDGYCHFSEVGYDCDGVCLNDADSDGVCDEFEISGCTSGGACNFSPSATDDDGSCQFAEAGFDCNGNCIFDVDQDGICDQWEVNGCQDSSACNYDPSATDPALCTYATTGYDCEGNCISDVDGDGVCDEFEVLGCTDRWACNFLASATDEDSSCSYPTPGYDCEGNCIIDSDFDGVCDAFEIVGCLDELACNYDVSATNSGDCTYAEEGYDCAGVCVSDEDEDGVCDQFELEGCLDPEAINYVEYATESTMCWYPEDFLDDCPLDLSGDGNINAMDLLLLLSGMGYSCEGFYGFGQ